MMMIIIKLIAYELLMVEGFFMFFFTTKCTKENQHEVYKVPCVLCENIFVISVVDPSL